MELELNEAGVGLDTYDLAKYLRKAQSMDADFSPLVVETHGRFHAGFVTLLKRLATQLDGGQGFTAREMAVLLNLDLIKGNAAHAAKVKSRVDSIRLCFNIKTLLQRPFQHKFQGGSGNEIKN